MGWVFDPHGGGLKIPVRNHEQISEEIENYSKPHSWHPETRLVSKFRGGFLLC